MPPLAELPDVGAGRGAGSLRWLVRPALVVYTTYLAHCWLKTMTVNLAACCCPFVRTLGAQPAASCNRLIAGRTSCVASREQVGQHLLDSQLVFRLGAAGLARTPRLPTEASLPELLLKRTGVDVRQPLVQAGPAHSNSSRIARMCFRMRCSFISLRMRAISLPSFRPFS